MSLCNRYTCLSPFDVRRQRAAEVFLLIYRLNNLNEKEEQGKHYQKTETGKTKVYVPVIS